jgi:hypothetical protein
MDVAAALLADALWPGLAAWTALYCSDYVLTIRCARLYQAGVKDTIVFEGSYELTPYFQKDVDALRSVSPRFLLALLWTVALLTALWYLCRQIGWSQAYLFVLGMLVLLQLAVHVRHVRNLYLFRAVLGSGGIRGRIEYPRSVALRLSSIELFAFGMTYLAICLVTQSAFVLGGCVSCCSQAWSHLKMARALESAPKAAGVDTVVATLPPRSAEGPPS